MLASILEPDFIVPLFIFAIPIVAITGGIVMAIVRALGRQRLIELAQRERIAAIERGMDPAQLPALNLAQAELATWWENPDRAGSPLRRAQGLLIGGIVTAFTGLGVIAFFLLLLHGDDKPVWAVGLIPTFIGAALLLSARLVWPKDGGSPGA